MPVQTRTTVGSVGAGNADALRARMVQQLMAEGISDPLVLRAKLEQRAEPLALFARCFLAGLPR